MEPQKKYEFSGETKTVGVTLLHRIRAVRDFTLANGREVRSGDEGAWIEKEANLSHDGTAWVADDAQVFGHAEVCGDAAVYGNAWVFGHAEVCGDAAVYGNAWVSGDAGVSGTARVCDNAAVYGDAYVYGNAWVHGAALVSGTARVYGNAEVYDNAQAYGNAAVYGNAKVYGDAAVSGDAEVKSQSDIIWFKNNWSSGRTFTYTRSNGKWKVGCFYGTGEELIKKAYADSEKSGKCYEAIVRATEAIYAAIGGDNNTKEN